MFWQFRFLEIDCAWFCFRAFTSVFQWWFSSFAPFLVISFGDLFWLAHISHFCHLPFMVLPVPPESLFNVSGSFPLGFSSFLEFHQFMVESSVFQLIMCNLALFLSVEIYSFFEWILSFFDGFDLTLFVPRFCACFGSEFTGSPRSAF